MSPDDLQNIFYSGYPAATSWAMLDEVFTGIDRGTLTYWSLDLVTKDAYKAICDSVVAIDGLGHQDKGHMALKQIATDYLREKYHCESYQETYVAGLHPDVMSKNGRYVIECGTTDPSCVPIYLDDPNIAWVGNIPYPFADETHLTLHIFSRGDQYLQWRQEKISSNRAVFEKYHRK